MSISVSTLAKFPPRSSLFKKTELPLQQFSPEHWASLQPPPLSALSALKHRLRLPLSIKNIQHACTHPSIVPHVPLAETNAQLAPLGNALLGLFAAEHLRASYPYLPTRVLKAAVTAHVGPLTCASIANEIGAGHLLRWQRSPTKPMLHTDALASIPRALTALVYQHSHNLLHARTFANDYFLSRDFDLRSMIKFRDPKKALLELVEKYNRDRPKSRLLKETGRFSNSPVFVVGIFSGADQLGEGFGSSLKMAEYRAAEDALHRVYLTKTPSHLLQIPSASLVDQQYSPPDLVEPEIMYSSSGRI